MKIKLKYMVLHDEDLSDALGFEIANKMTKEQKIKLAQEMSERLAQNWDEIIYQIYHDTFGGVL